MAPETSATLQWIVSGGATTVLLWLVYQLMNGNLLSRKNHEEIVTPLRDTIKEQNVRIVEVTKEASEAIKTVTDTQRAAIDEQRQTIALLHEINKRDRDAKDSR